MRVVVTGGAGYIGSHICKALSESGFEPVVFDNLLYGHEWAVKWGPLEKGDIRDKSALRDCFERYQPEALIHCAALTYVGESVQKPLSYYETNVSGTINILQMLEERKKIPFVVSSTCAVYGQPEYLPLNENHPKRPVSPYGRTKLMMEQIVQDSGFPYAFLRYFNASGSAGEIGEDHHPENHLIPLALDAALDQTPLKVFGNDYPTPDGTAVRDYVHVVDLARAHVEALKKLLSGASSMAVNLGTGHGTSVRQIIESVENVTKKKVPLQMAPRREGDPSELVADPRLAIELLGWTAQCQNIEEIIRTAYEWQIKKRSF